MPAADPRPLDETVSVSPQILPEDLPALARAGVRTIICNRPDAEVPPDLSTARVREAAEAAGLAFVDNPMTPGMLSMDVVEAQRQAIESSEGPVLAYCASGTRSAYLWAFAMATSGRLGNEEILRALEKAGYPAAMLGPQLDRLRQD